MKFEVLLDIIKAWLTVAVVALIGGSVVSLASGTSEGIQAGVGVTIATLIITLLYDYYQRKLGVPKS